MNDKIKVIHYKPPKKAKPNTKIKVINKPGNKLAREVMGLHQKEISK